MSAYQLHRDQAAIEAAAARSLTRADRDTRSEAEFAAALEAETDASLARDPSRWPWTSSPQRVALAEGQTGATRRTRELP